MVGDSGFRFLVVLPSAGDPECERGDRRGVFCWEPVSWRDEEDADLIGRGK
jgi:hypothetical protein